MAEPPGKIEPIRSDGQVPVQDRRGSKGRVGPLVTFVEQVRPDGVVARWGSRDHRKHLQGALTAGSTWWAPKARGWWIAVLFAVGSLLFALGAVPGYASAVGARWDAVTFFAGSLFFTSAGFLTYREAVDAGPQAPGAARRRFFVFQPRRIDWWATAVQLAGTLFFNISTGNALREDLTAQAAHQHVWRPDAVGSVCFLVASALAWFEVCHGWTGWRPRSWSWWITLAQPDRVRGLRRVRRGRLHQPVNRPAAQRRAVEPGYLHRRAVLLRRRAAAPARTDRTSQRPGDDTRCQRRLNPRAACSSPPAGRDRAQGAGRRRASLEPSPRFAGEL